MKITFTRIILIMLLCATSIFVKAQSGTKTSISIGPDFGIPLTSAARSVYKTGIGGNIKVELPVTSALHITVTGGYSAYKTKLVYLNFSSSSLPPVTPTGHNPSLPGYHFIPLKAGLRYYYTRYLYIAAEAGEAFKTNTAAKSSFIYSGGLGGAVPVAVHQAIELGLRYERGYKNIDYERSMSEAGISVAYKYQF